MLKLNVNDEKITVSELSELFGDTAPMELFMILDEHKDCPRDARVRINANLKRLCTRVVELRLPVTYDSRLTGPAELAVAFDQLLETALSTEGILSDEGNPTVGSIVWDGADE